MQHYVNAYILICSCLFRMYEIGSIFLYTVLYTVLISLSPNTVYIFSRHYCVRIICHSACSTVRSVFRFYNKIAFFAKNICSNIGCYSYVWNKKIRFLYANILEKKLLFPLTLCHEEKKFRLKESVFFLLYATR